MALTPPSAPSLVSQILTKGRLGPLPQQQPYAVEMLGNFVEQLTSKTGITPGTDPLSFIQARIAQIDAVLSAQLDAILHYPALQKLEASWRGLNYLVMHTETGVDLRLRLLNVSKEELSNDLEKAIDFDQSALFKKVYSEEYGTFGGSPYSCLVADYEFGSIPPDINLLDHLANVGSAALTPILTAASPQMFDLESFTELGNPRDLSLIFQGADKIQWQSFREKEEARYVGLFLPHVLMRLPYGPNTLPVQGLNYQETVDPQTLSTFVWGNAAYMMAQRITNAFFLYGWTAAIRGVEGGGLVEDLPTYTFKSTDGDIAVKCPTEIAITDRRENELSSLGFVALCYCKGTDKAAFFGNQTAQKPLKYNLPSATANANLSARLSYMLAACRFGHYIKVIMRDKIGSFMSRQDVQIYLQTWIAQYVLLTDDAPQALLARYPLREASVEVFDVPGDPGRYTAIIFLRPHFQLEELTVSLRLVAELPPPAK